jgi:hypothetical protein
MPSGCLANTYPGQAMAPPPFSIEPYHIIDLFIVDASSPWVDLIGTCHSSYLWSFLILVFLIEILSRTQSGSCSLHFASKFIGNIESSQKSRWNVSLSDGHAACAARVKASKLKLVIIPPGGHATPAFSPSPFLLYQEILHFRDLPPHP